MKIMDRKRLCLFERKTGFKSESGGKESLCIVFLNVFEFSIGEKQRHYMR